MTAAIVLQKRWIEDQMMPEDKPEYPPKLPSDWPQWSKEQRLAFLRSTEPGSSEADTRLLRRKARALENQKLFWQECLGDRLIELMNSRALAEEALGDLNPKIRLGALEIVNEYWTPDPAHEDIYRRLAISDPDLEVRARAIPCWGHLYRASIDREVSNVLAKIAREESYPLDLRRAAYFEFFNVQGREVSFEVSKSLFLSKDRMPKELDWSMIDRFLS